MIIYNIRANGPYEYDKFILNFGQLYNLCQDMKKDYKTGTILEQNAKLTKEIKDRTQVIQYDIIQTQKNDNLLNQVAMLQEILL